MSDLCLYLVRHAPTKLNEPGKERVRSQLGVRPDPEALKRWTKHVAGSLADKDVAFVACSDIPRGRDSGMALADALGLPHDKVVTTPALRTWDSGSEVEWKPYDEVEGVLKHYVEHPDETPAGGEAFREPVQRLRLAVAALEEMARKLKRSGAVVVHGNQLMAIEHVKTGKPLRYVKHNELPRPGSVFRLRIT